MNHKINATIQKRRFFCRLTALTLTVVLLAFCFLPSAAASQAFSASASTTSASTITVRNAKDLTALSKNCALDTWSIGKTVVLESDIDLSGTEFSPIPTFGGTFEGNGHTISGLQLSEGYSYQGFFRYIQESGVVRDLNVSGAVSAAGDQTFLGGITGSNEGSILDCTFSGEVSGKLQIGGIAGVNESTGSIFHCTAEGTVTGERNTGGITGQNSGTVTSCTNRSSVNTVHQEKDRTLGDSLNSLTKEDILDTTMDIGGIAGMSDGILRSCTNEGSIGYPHVGYNVGGIVGRSSGYLDRCENKGEVRGRKDTGGIAGQSSPDIRLIFHPDTIDELKEELSRLNAMIDDAVDHAENTGDTISSRFDQISDYGKTAADSISSLSDIMGDWADDSIKTINDASDTLADTLNRLESVADDASDMLDSAAGGVDKIQKSLDEIADALDIAEDGMDDLADGVKNLRAALRQAQSSLDTIRDALKKLSRALIVKDQEAFDAARALLSSGTEQLTKALAQSESAAENIAGLLKELASGNDEHLKYLPDYLQLLADGFRAASQAAAQIGRGVVTGIGGMGTDWQQVKKSCQDITSAMDSLSDAFNALDRSMKSIRSAFGEFSDMSDAMSDGLRHFSDSMDVFEKITRDMTDIADEIRDLFHDLAARDPIEFDTLGDDFHQAEDDLHQAITSIGDQLDLLRASLRSSSDTLSADLRGLGDQFQVISDLLLDALTDTQDKDSDDLWSDVSEEDIDSVTLGKIRGCKNSGTVEGDLDVGGIVGSMAVEYALDPEDELTGDITEIGERSFNFRYETRAVLQECVNTGTVASKKNAAGGIVGRMELGYILSCENYGSVESTGGSYVGGIAGISDSTIRSCWSKCTLTGGSYIGGIAGYAYRLSQCVSLITVEKSAGYTGSVAGDWDRENGALSQNRFVGVEPAGIDGISYAGKAEPVDYETLIQQSDVPEPFLHFTVTWTADDETIQTALFSYGESLSAYDVPQVPEKDGYYGVWEDIGSDIVTSDYTIEAVYTPSVTTLASESMRDDVHAVFLAEGEFDGNAVLNAKQIEQSDGSERWTVTLTGAENVTGLQIRFAPPSGWDDVALRLLDESRNKSVSWKKEGSYCVFTVDSGSFTLEAAKKEALSGWLIALLAVILPVAVLCLGLLFWKKHTKTKKGDL